MGFFFQLFVINNNSLSHQIIEIKARCNAIDTIRNSLIEQRADFKGKDHQIDTYFHVPKGRLKLREGDLETFLIQYNRPNQTNPKLSRVNLYRPEASEALKNVLIEALDVLVEVEKFREIYFIENVKFHLDWVPLLGNFVEIEAIDHTEDRTEDFLRNQCNYYMNLFEIKKEDLIEDSYSDLILRTKNQ